MFHTCRFLSFKSTPECTILRIIGLRNWRSSGLWCHKNEWMVPLVEGEFCLDNDNEEHYILEWFLLHSDWTLQLKLVLYHSTNLFYHLKCWSGMFTHTIFISSFVPYLQISKFQVNSWVCYCLHDRSLKLETVRFLVPCEWMLPVLRMNFVLMMKLQCVYIPKQSLFPVLFHTCRFLSFKLIPECVTVTLQLKLVLLCSTISFRGVRTFYVSCKGSRILYVYFQFCSIPADF